MHEFNTVGMSEVSANELEQTEGGMLGLLVAGLVGGFLVGYGGKRLADQAGEPLGSAATGLLKGIGKGALNQ